MPALPLHRRERHRSADDVIAADIDSDIGTGIVPDC
jgi:hypothetical protein